MKLTEIHTLEDIGYELIRHALDKGERIWISYQGRVDSGRLQDMQAEEFSFDGTPSEQVNFEVDVQPRGKNRHWSTNWWTLDMKDFADRVRIKPATEPGYKWHVTILQRRKLKEEGTLETMGFNFIINKIEKGEKVWVRVETVAAMTNEQTMADFNFNTKRHAFIERVEKTEARLYPVFDFLVPAKTTSYVLVPIEMGPELQEDWMVKKLDKGWLAWREV